MLKSCESIESLCSTWPCPYIFLTTLSVVYERLKLSEDRKSILFPLHLVISVVHCSIKARKE